MHTTHHVGVLFCSNLDIASGSFGETRNLKERYGKKDHVSHCRPTICQCLHCSLRFLLFYVLFGTVSVAFTVGGVKRMNPLCLRKCGYLSVSDVIWLFHNCRQNPKDTRLLLLLRSGENRSDHRSIFGGFLGLVGYRTTFQSLRSHTPSNSSRRMMGFDGFIFRFCYLSAICMLI